MVKASSAHQQTNSKNSKSERIIDAAFGLFLERGDLDASVQEITERAGVAKGTFYSYFQDKDELKECMITQKSHELFRRAVTALRSTEIRDFSDQIIFVINYLINELAANPMSLRLIAKNLSYGVLNQKMQAYVGDEKSDIVKILLQAARRSGIRLSSPRVLLFMIIELTSSTCFSCILEEKPLSIDEYKPYLFATIRQMIAMATEKDMFIFR